MKLPPNADFNHDGILTTAELDAYVNQHLKEIAAVFPDLVASREAEELPGPARAPPPASSNSIPSSRASAPRSRWSR